jgi:hypothetical protein
LNSGHDAKFLNYNILNYKRAIFTIYIFHFTGEDLMESKP